MQPEARHRIIEDHLNKVEFASLEELAQQVDASVSTVRRDVINLEDLGRLRRTHGGARLLNPKSDEFAFTARDTHQLEEKELIARACAELVPENQTVIIDAGTTCYRVARHLDNKALHVFTNSLPVANHFGSSQKVEVVVSGGVIYPRLGVLVGPLATEAFAKARADIAIMSAAGITVEGVTNSHGLLIDIQQAMMRAAGKVILCVDHTKFGRQSVSRLCGLEEVDTLVTDAAPPSELAEAFEAAGVEIVLATGTASVLLKPAKTKMPDGGSGHLTKKEAGPERPQPSSEQPTRKESVFTDRDRFID
jgi:DeoR family transcriptional regulator, fructose operon transcriptional repressor